MRALAVAFALVLLAACSSVGGEDGRGGSTPEATPPATSPTEAGSETPYVAPTLNSSPELPSCGTDNAFFSVPPVDLSDFVDLVPLGNLAPSAHVFPTDHVYFFINRVDSSQRELGTIEVPVVSPGDVWVTQISSSGSEDRTDYGMRFSPCDEVEAFFIHVSSLSERLEQNFSPPYDECNEYSTGGSNYRNCSKTINVKLSAGELIGTAGGDQWQNALDLGVYDLRTDPHPYANPDRWGEKSLHVVCPLDYFTPDVRDALRAKLGRAAPPVCGEVEQDEPGTAQGVWFMTGTTYTDPSEDLHLALVHDNFDPSTGVFSVGVSMTDSGLSSGLYYFDPASSGLVNRDFKDVAADEAIYCYETRDRFGDGPLPFVILVQLTSPTTLRSERQDSASCGNGPWQFGSAYTDYER